VNGYDGTLNDPRDTDKGWTVEIKWPWKSLSELVHSKLVSAPPADGDNHVYGELELNALNTTWDLLLT